MSLNDTAKRSGKFLAELIINKANMLPNYILKDKV